MKSSLGRWQANFYAGLAVTLPVILSLAILKWLFGTIANITDVLLFWLPYVPLMEPEWIYRNGRDGEMLLGWSILAFLLALLIITMIGRFTRNYFGRKIIQFLDWAILQVPLLNKVYGAIKQVNDALGSNKKTAFQQVVMVEFPKDGVYSVGFITSEQNAEVQQRTQEEVISVFVPTTPNPTTGFLIMVPENKVTKLDMTVADGIKFIISLGSVSPVYSGAAPLVDPAKLPAATSTTPAAEQSR
jgi:uncharacterized membrane protein